MDLHTSPIDLKVEFLFQLFDDALADVAEGSDVIGKDLHEDRHENNLVFRHLKRYLNSSTVLNYILIVQSLNLFQESAGGLHKTDAFRQFVVAGLLLACGICSIDKAGQAAAGPGQEREDLRAKAAKFGRLFRFELLQRFPGIVQRIVPCAALAAEAIVLLTCQYTCYIMVCAEMIEEFHV
jgi:hypothetical protein